MKEPPSNFSLGARRIFVVLCALLAPWVHSEIQFETTNPQRINWKQLKYSASKFLVSLETTVQYGVLTREEAIQQLLPVPEGKSLQPVAARVHKIALQTDVLGLHSAIELWINPDMSALQRISLSTGRKFYFRSLRYHAQGVSSVRQRPAFPAEEKLDHSLWSHTSHNFYPVAIAEQVLPLSEAEGLFYLVPTTGFAEPGEIRIAYVYDRKGAVQLDLQVKERFKLNVDFLEKTDSRQQRVTKSIDTLRIRVEARPVQGDSKLDFSFLGYKENIDLYYDPEKRLIMQISGKADYLGMVNIKLEEAEYRSAN